MTNGDDVLHDAATVVGWNDPEGIGEAVTDNSARRVWLHYSMHAHGFGSEIFFENARLEITYRATDDQDGFSWVGIQCRPLSRIG